MNFHQTSTKFNQLINSLYSLYCIRYAPIVDNSERGVDCTYAKMCERFHYENQEAELAALKQIVVELQKNIQVLEDLDGQKRQEERRLTDLGSEESA